MSLLLFHLLLWDVPFGVGWKLLLCSLITLAGFGLTGYFLNDWADIPYDRRVGKANLVDGISSVWRPIIFLGLLAVTLFPWFVYFRVDEWSLGLIALQFILQVVYPVPPVRLKNHPFVAIVVDAMYAFVVPAILAWHTFDLTSGLNENSGQFMHFGFLALWMFAMGVRHIIAHHVTDRENDRMSGTPNLALVIAPLKLRRFLQTVLFPVELLSSIFFFAVLFRDSGFLPLVVILMVVMAGARDLREGYPFFSVSFGETGLDRFISFQLGFLCVVLLSLKEPAYLIILLLYLLLFTYLFFHPVSRILFRRMWKWPIEQASLAFNWGIYYFRKWILRWPEERNWGMHYPKRLEELAANERSKKGIVAVFNHNYAKYTETFVAGHLRKLPYHVVFFHGWPSPTHVGDMESLIASEGFIRTSIRELWELLDLNFREFEDRRIADRLINDKADLILAEFGTMGARCISLSRKTGIPLIPIFYGYDAWHSKTLQEFETGYGELFQLAPLIIGVSQDICSHLIELGCPSEKVMYLPCYVDLERFAFQERTFEDPEFLSVGRLCQTKAPFITLNAFKLVVDAVPNAKLRMIGNDDGGVKETVISLIRSLGLEEHVELIGSCTSEEVRDHMNKASIFVQHSITTPMHGDKEGTPVAVMEAMATGLPVVATRHAGIAEMVEHGVTGVLVDEFDYLRMADEMIGLVNDKERMLNMGKAASEAIRTNRLVRDHIGILTEKLSKFIER